jgi:molybdenum cofactor cytidylyltransferase
LSRIQAIILAAGASRRLGFPKALARFGRRSALQIAVENVRGAGLPPPIVVLGYSAAFLRPYVTDLGARPVENRRWEEGQLSSFRAGLRRAPKGTTGIMLYPVDYPLIRPRHVVRLVQAFEQIPTLDIFCPTYRGHGGHPVLFRARLRREFMRLKPKQTARDVFYKEPARNGFVPIESNAHRSDFDTPAQYRRVQRRIRS